MVVKEANVDEFSSLTGWRKMWQTGVQKVSGIESETSLEHGEGDYKSMVNNLQYLCLKMEVECSIGSESDAPEVLLIKQRLAQGA